MPLSQVLLVAWALISPSAAQAGPATPATEPAPSAEAIMARVAVSQDRAEAARAQFVYVQHARVQSRRGSTVQCEEVTDTRIAPSPHGQTQVLLSLSGHVHEGNRVIHYTRLPGAATGGPNNASGTTADDTGLTLNIGDKRTILDAEANNTPVQVNDTDLDLVESMRREMTADKGSKDGVEAGLFPLTTKQQQTMSFTLQGRESKNGRDTFHIVFRPKDKTDYSWKGDAWIDAHAFQPVVVRTALNRSLPLGVRTLLGTNLPGLGFTAVYAPQAGDVWFPASFGTEFKVKALFLFHREVVVAVENRDFERTHVQTTIHGENSVVVAPEEPAPNP